MTTRPVSLVAAVAATFLLGACSGDPGPPAPSAPAVDVLPVGLNEWEIATSGHDVAPGAVTLRVLNVGAAAHDLHVRGAAGQWRTPVLGPGEGADLVIETEPGEQLHLDCTLTGHHAAGMHAVVDVSAATGDGDIHGR